MLYNDMVCRNAQSQLVETEMSITTSNLQVGREYVIGTFFSLIQACPSAGTALATQALSAFVESEIADEDIWETNYAQLALYGLSLSGIILVYDTAKGSLSMHTSSMSVIEALKAQDKIEIAAGKTMSSEMDRWAKQLSDLPKGAIQKSLQEGNVIRTVRLELQPNGKYTITIPRSCINFEEQPIIPHAVMTQELLFVMGLAKTQLVEVTMGTKVRYVTLSRDILSKVYDANRVETLLRSQSCMGLGDSYVYLPSVGASKYTPGLTRVDLLNVNFLRGGDLSKVDLSQVNVNYDYAKFFLIGYMKESTIKSVANAIGVPLELLQGKNVTQIKDYLTATIMRMYDTDAYNAVIKLGITPEEFSSYSSPLGNSYEEVAVPSSVGELLARLSTGVYKLVYVKRDGKFDTLIGTNCDKNLKVIYGANYMRKFESEGVRLRKVMHKVMQKGSMERDTLLNMCDKLGLDTLKSEIAQTFMLSAEVSSEQVVGIVSKYLQSVEARRTTKPNPDNVLVRNCFATVENGETNNYYRNIDFRSIKAIYKLTE